MPAQAVPPTEALLSCAIAAARCPVLLAAEGLELVVGRPLTTPR